MEKNKEQAELFLSHGTQKLQEAEYTQALSLLLKAYSLNPKHSKIVNNLAMAYYFKEELLLAEEKLKEAIALDPKNMSAKLNLASLYLQKNQMNKAENIYQDSLKDLSYPLHYQTYYNLGLISLRRSDLDKAEQFFAKSVKEKQDYCPSHLELGKIFFEKEEWEKSYDSFKHSTKGICYNNPDGHFYQAKVLEKMSQNQKALLKYREITDRFPNTSFGKQSEEHLYKLGQTQ